MKVENMKSSRTGRAIPNQFEIDNGMGTCYFQSYGTMIATVGMGRIKLDKIYWDFSTTTSKYRNMFLRMTTKEIKAKIKSGEIELVDLNK